MVTRRIVLRAMDVVLFKGIVEASDGLAAVFAERGGDLTVAAPADRATELDTLLGDMAADIGALLVGP